LRSRPSALNRAHAANSQPRKSTVLFQFAIGFNRWKFSTKAPQRSRRCIPPGFIVARWRPARNRPENAILSQQSIWVRLKQAAPPFPPTLQECHENQTHSRPIFDSLIDSPGMAKPKSKS
jgi:hypothetical protein